MPTLSYSLRLFIWCLLLFITGNAVAAVTATADRQHVNWGESFNLTLTATDGDTIGQPDLSSLDRNFRVLGQSSSRNYQYINGKSSSTRTLTIQLVPKRTGELTIPALQTAAGKTDAITITVANHPQDPDAHARSDLFIDVDISPKEVYVGQQATLVATLYYDLDLNGGSLNNPSAPHATIAPLGKAQQFTRTINNRHYRAYRQEFSIVPTEPGTLSIPGITFDGEKLVATSRNMFGMNISGFGRSEAVTAASDAIKLKVLPIPTDWTGLWLPAKQLTLSADQPQENTTLRVGEPVDLTLTLTAIGLPAESLPDLTLPDIDGVSIYPDQTRLDNSQVDGLVKGIKTRHFAIIPRRSGDITLPATTLNWFDTKARKKRTARIPAQHVTVAAAPAATNASPTTDKAATPSSVTPTAPSTHSAPHDTQWKIAFFVSLLLWLLIMLLWLYRRQRRHRTLSAAQPHQRNDKVFAKRQFLLALKQHDPQLLTALLLWAKQDNPAIVSLAQLKAALSPQQAAIVAALERWRYSTPTSAFPDTTAANFDNGLQWQGNSTNSTPIQPLYPDDHHK